MKFIIYVGVAQPVARKLSYLDAQLKAPLNQSNDGQKLEIQLFLAE